MDREQVLNVLREYRDDLCVELNLGGYAAQRGRTIDRIVDAIDAAIAAIEEYPDGS